MNHSPSADEKLADHAGTLADVLLNQLRAAQTDEGAICVMGDRTGKQGLSRSRRTVEKNALRLLDTEGHEERWRCEYLGSQTVEVGCLFRKHP